MRLKLFKKIRSIFTLQPYKQWIEKKIKSYSEKSENKSIKNRYQNNGYLNGLDREMPRLDVLDDYKSEFAEVKRSKGPQFPFSFGDYVAKCFLGSIDPDMDRFDE